MSEVDAKDVKPGDWIDLAGDPFLDDDDIFEYEYAIVEEVVRETPANVVIHFQNGSYSFPPDHKLCFVKHEPREE